MILEVSCVTVIDRYISISEELERIYWLILADIRQIISFIRRRRLRLILVMLLGAVTGCADIKLTSGMWQLLPSRRQQDEPGAADDARNRQHHLHPQHQLLLQQAVIRCNATDEQWRLTCRDNSWVGQLGNCSPAAAKRETKRRVRTATRHCHARHRHSSSTEQRSILTSCPLQTFFTE